MSQKKKKTIEHRETVKAIFLSQQKIEDETINVIVRSIKKKKWKKGIIEIKIHKKDFAIRFFLTVQS